MSASANRTDLPVNRSKSPKHLATCRLPTPWGVFALHAYVDSLHDKLEHLVLTMGLDKHGMAPLVRIHSECLTGDALFSMRCDCGEQLKSAMAIIGAEGRGMVLYLRQEGRGIGLRNKLAAYALQDEGFDTVEANRRLGSGADVRDYSTAVALFREFDVKAVSLLTNNPKKIESLTAGGIDVVERISLLAEVNEHNSSYLNAKAERLGHLIGRADLPSF
jgi:GTP cyclohydrolase II